MTKLNLKPTHKAIRDYYTTLQQYEQHDITHEGAVSSPFDTLLHACAKQVNATLVPQYQMRAPTGNRIVIDGVVLDEYGLPFAYWEAKDTDDDLLKAVEDKRAAGYPLDNILFQNPQRAHPLSERRRSTGSRHHRTGAPDCSPPISVFLDCHPRSTTGRRQSQISENMCRTSQTNSKNSSRNGTKPIQRSEGVC